MITEGLNQTNTKVIDNDYFGMAQDLRRMRKIARKVNLITFIDLDNFIDNISEFEDYCLDQPILEIGEMIKDQVRSLNSYI